MKKTVLTLLFGLFSIVFMHAQQTVVKGVIIDSETTEPVSDVSVSIQGTTLTKKTDDQGQFNFSEGLPLGDQMLIVSKNGFFPKRFAIIIEEGKVLDMATVVIKEDAGEINDFTISLSDDELNDDDAVASNTSGVLQASRDVFARAAAFDFSGTFFRVRGLDSENGQMMLNGIRMNKAFNGRPQWSNWGGINDVMRNQDFTNGSKANEYSFGGILGTTNINTRASSYRKGARVSYASSNRSYRNRVMATYASGVREDGWSFALSAGRRWGEEGYMDGTVYDANSVFASVEKKINDKHSINFTSIYTPNRRGKSAPMTQEVFELKGRQYNSYWGYQDGEIRNSRIREIEEPILMLNHYWNISDKTTLNTNIAHQFGHIGNSRLDFNGANPDPTYYRNLPSYALAFDQSTTSLANAYLLEQEFLSDGQIDWNQMYADNASANSQNFSDVYLLYEDRNDDKQWSFNTILNTELAENISLNASLNYSTLKSHNYAKALDLLGGTGYLDIDYFDNFDNNTQTPSRVIQEGDTFRYNYNIMSSTYDAFAQAQFKYSKIDFYVGGQFGQTSHQREGLYENGAFVGNSLGKGDKLEFDKFGGKAGFTYKISGKHLIDVNGVYSQDAPTIRNSFSNSRQNNDIVNNLSEVKTTSFDASYIFRSSMLKTRLTGYYSTIEDATEVAFYYADGLSIQNFSDAQAFVQEALTGVDKRNMGVEFGAEAQVTPTIKLKGALAVGQSIYNNNPNLYLSSDDFNGTQDLGKAYLKDYNIAGGPQRAGSIGFEYRDPKYWWFGATANFFSHAYLDVAAITRTANFGLDQDGIQISDYDENIARELLQQEQFDDYMLVNLVGGKSWKINDKYIGFFASINNVFGETYKTGGYEQSRSANYTNLLEDTQRSKRLFGPKYWFGRGTTYFMNLYLRF
ncbi:carboxypeptidase-like regulatory domain-containing protein [Pseudofulvibacter geojedonensis]|uniref:Carboxypeptidase-like regulatory domain-containing protein n=1 Tax=Pseudofulvibacter geojedonensis TaxID=1123758 RepID=A0ABW3I409_9FLAO